MRPYVFHITFLLFFGVFNIHVQVSRSDYDSEETITVGNSNLTIFFYMKLTNIIKMKGTVSTIAEG